MNNTTQYAVIYRTGGTENFKWVRVLGSFTRDAAFAQKDELERMGYKSLVHQAAQLDAIGLPDTFSADTVLRAAQKVVL